MFLQPSSPSVHPTIKKHIGKAPVNMHRCVQSGDQKTGDQFFQNYNFKTDMHQSSEAPSGSSSSQNSFSADPVVKAEEDCTTETEVLAEVISAESAAYAQEDSRKLVENKERPVVQRNLRESKQSAAAEELVCARVSAG